MSTTTLLDEVIAFLKSSGAKGMDEPAVVFAGVLAASIRRLPAADRLAFTDAITPHIRWLVGESLKEKSETHV